MFGGVNSARVLGKYYKDNSVLKVEITIDGLGFFHKYNLILASGVFIISLAIVIYTTVKTLVIDTSYSPQLIIFLIPLCIAFFIIAVIFTAKQHVKIMKRDLEHLLENIGQKSKAKKL